MWYNDKIVYTRTPFASFKRGDWTFPNLKMKGYENAYRMEEALSRGESNFKRGGKNGFLFCREMSKGITFYWILYIFFNCYILVKVATLPVWSANCQVSGFKMVGPNIFIFAYSLSGVKKRFSNYIVLTKDV